MDTKLLSVALKRARVGTGRYVYGSGQTWLSYIAASHLNGNLAPLLDNMQ